MHEPDTLGGTGTRAVRAQRCVEGKKKNVGDLKKRALINEGNCVLCLRGGGGEEGGVMSCLV